MISEALQRARDYESRYAPLIPDTERPLFHATPSVGWMNDPNGFSFYRGECHLFYQYHPYSCEWGPMHWGHLKTKDFIRWERLPVVLAPDKLYDSAGCFSGSAQELPDGRHLLLYTGVRRKGETDVQTQCVAVGDGVNYEKYSLNPVLDETDLPQGGSRADFRDPKLWASDSGYDAVIGNRTPDGSGAALLFHSPDGFQWTFARTLDRSQNRYGRMWECPDYFPLGGRQILFVSPQDMTPIGLEFHAGNGVVCLIGEEGKSGFVRQAVQAVDYGIDFYAPQTLLTPDGRRVMIGWMQNWNTVGHRLPGCRWFGQMSVPRELSLRDGRLTQAPVRELEQYRGEAVRYRGVPLEGPLTLPGVRGRVLDMTVSVRPAGDRLRAFRLYIAEGKGYETALRWDPEEGVMELDRSGSGICQDVVHARRFPVQAEDGGLTLRVVLDRFSVEVFASGGRAAASAVLCTPQEADGIRFEADGAALLDVEKYELVFDGREGESR